MSDRVQRWISVLATVAIVGGVGWLTAIQKDGPRPIVAAAEPADAGAEASVASASADGGKGDITGPIIVAGDGGFGLDASLSLMPSLFGDGGMPSGAPRAIRIGVVLVQHQGAEGASSASRSKKDALELATRLAEGAKSDFKKAVKEGDTGSSEDIGRMPRGVLDPRTEIAVFSLAAGDVSEVLETPRGYWIVKRIE